MTRQQNGSSGHYSGWWWLLIACQCAGEAGVENKSRLRRCGLHDRSACTLLLKSVGQGWCTDGCTVGCASLLSTWGPTRVRVGVVGTWLLVTSAWHSCVMPGSPFLYMVWLLCLCTGTGCMAGQLLPLRLACRLHLSKGGKLYPVPGACRFMPASRATYVLWLASFPYKHCCCWGCCWGCDGDCYWLNSATCKLS